MKHWTLLLAAALCTGLLAGCTAGEAPSAGEEPESAVLTETAAPGTDATLAELLDAYGLKVTLPEGAGTLVPLGEAEQFLPPADSGITVEETGAPLFGGGEVDSLTDAGHASGYLADGESLAGLTGLLAGVDTTDGDFQAQLYATDEAAELWIVVAAYDETAGRYTGCEVVSGSGGELNAAGRLDALPEGSRFLALGLIEPSEGTSASSPLRVLLPAE